MFHYFGISKKVERCENDELPTYSEIIRDSNSAPVFGPEELSPRYLDYTQTVPINIPNQNLSEFPTNSQPNNKKQIFCTYIFVLITCMLFLILFSRICNILGKYI